MCFIVRKLAYFRAFLDVLTNLSNMAVQPECTGKFYSWGLFIA